MASEAPCRFCRWRHRPGGRRRADEATRGERSPRLPAPRRRAARVVRHLQLHQAPRMLNDGPRREAISRDVGVGRCAIVERSSSSVRRGVLAWSMCSRAQRSRFPTSARAHPVAPPLPCLRAARPRRLTAAAATVSRSTGADDGRGAAPAAARVSSVGPGGLFTRASMRDGLRGGRAARGGGDARSEASEAEAAELDLLRIAEAAAARGARLARILRATVPPVVSGEALVVPGRTRDTTLLLPPAPVGGDGTMAHTGRMVQPQHAAQRTTAGTARG